MLPADKLDDNVMAVRQPNTNLRRRRLRLILGTICTIQYGVPLFRVTPPDTPVPPASLVVIESLPLLVAEPDPDLMDTAPPRSQRAPEGVALARGEAHRPSTLVCDEPLAICTG